MRGCPICGYDYGTWSLNGQRAHIYTEHSWWRRFLLRRATRTSVEDLLINRKYGHLILDPSTNRED
jgi:hypothetical protein